MLTKLSLSTVLPGRRERPDCSRLLAFTALVFLAGIGIWAVVARTRFASPSYSGSVADADARLQQAATLALGDRRGTVIVMDPQTGRVRAVVNETIACEQSFRPGSTIKPFTALAALRSGLIKEDSRTLCHEKYVHEDFHTTCSHPRDLSPLNPTEAIAYSCNYFFGNVGEHLAESTYTSTLSEFGFGRKTGVNVEESPGKLLRLAWHSQNAIGEGDNIQATPLQLINAYAALVNGGQLFTPSVTPARGFVPAVSTKIMMESQHRALILKGMRGAVRYGTAESAHLYTMPAYIFGKTGTATEIDGFRTQGWFVGFASRLTAGADDAAEVAPGNVDLAVLVFLAKAHGSDAAKVARPIFEEYASTVSEGSGLVGNTEVAVKEHEDDSSAVLTPPATPAMVRVHQVRENITTAMTLEDYVLGVVAAEGSTESEPEALKAQAIASRTYALKNMARHAQDGYDFCSSSHCQRFRAVDVDSTSYIAPGIVQAVKETKGLVLSDSDNRLADSYFSASCGGATANIGALWGGAAPAYLKGVTDEYCPTEAHHRWSDVISSAQLLKALQSDPRTNIGSKLHNIAVSRRDQSGRAETITLAGDRRLAVKGWDFKIVVSRVLGWNLLKSSRFSISRSGSDYVFAGYGFGHGLGLCQEGAHVMAVRGIPYRSILAKYFPTTHVANIGSLTSTSPSLDLDWSLENSTEPIPPFVPQKIAVRQVLSSEHFRLDYPATITRQEATSLLRFLQASRGSLISRLTGVGYQIQLPPLEVFVNQSTGDFVGRTGQPAWAAAATNGHRIELQPLPTLKRRQILETTLRHELTHTLIDTLGHGRTPRWLAEGLAVHYADEGRLVSRYQPQTRMTTDQIERQLLQPSSAEDLRIAYAAAYAEVKRLISSEGEKSVWRRVAN